MGDGGFHRAFPNGRAPVFDRIEADDHDFARFPCGGNGFNGSERHHVVTGEQGVDFAVSLQDVLKNVESQVALPVGRLRCDHLDMRCGFHRIEKSLQAGLRGFVPWDAFENHYLPFALGLFHSGVIATTSTVSPLW